LVNQEIGFWDAINEIHHGSGWWFQLTPVPVPSKAAAAVPKSPKHSEDWKLL
jgi:hypothetical protein